MASRSQRRKERKTTYLQCIILQDSDIQPPPPGNLRVKYEIEQKSFSIIVR